MEMNSEDKHAFDVLNQILSGMDGRLFRILRNEQSLAYATHGVKIDGYTIPGFYGIYIGTSPEKKVQAISEIEDILKNLLKDGVNKEELKHAKGHLTGSFALQLQSYNAQSEELAFSEIY